MNKLLSKLREDKAYTLIELIITLAIISIISIPILTFFTSNYSIYFNETNKIEAMQLVSSGMDKIISDLRRAEQSSIVKKNDTSIQMIILGKRYEYLLQNNIIYESIDGGKNQLIYNVESFKVEYDLMDRGPVVTLTIKVKSPGENGYEYELKNSYKIRN